MRSLTGVATFVGDDSVDAWSDGTSSSHCVYSDPGGSGWLIGYSVLAGGHSSLTSTPLGMGLSADVAIPVTGADEAVYNELQQRITARTGTRVRWIIVGYPYAFVANGGSVQDLAIKLLEEWISHG